MAKYDIRKTKIGTGETANIADDKAIPIYEGFHFPKGWSKAVDLDFFNNTKNFTLSILHGKVSTDTQLSIGFGLAGPSWAGTMDVDGSLDGKSLQLNIYNDNFVSGMLMGAAISFAFNLQIQYQRETFEFEWRHPFDAHWKMAWHDLIRMSPQAEFDLLTALYNLVKLVVGIGKFIPGISKILKVLPDIDLPIPRTYNQGIAEHVSSSVLFPGGLEFPTQIEGTWDLITIIELVGASAVEVAQPEVSPIVEIYLKLQKVLKTFVTPAFETGPVIGFKFITYLRITGVNAYWGDDKYEASNVKELGEGLVGDLSDSAPDSAPDKLGIEFDHRPAVDFTLGWYGKLSWLKIFAIGDQKEVSAGDLWSGFTTPIGQAYTYEIRNDEGSTSTDKVVVEKVDAWIFDTN